MIDINSDTFIENFDISKGTIGLLGHGYVGTAVDEYFKKVCKVVVYDKAMQLDTLEDVVSQAEVIFVCVPTPMRKDGSCFTGIIEAAVDDIVKEAARIGRNLDSFIVVIKSTVSPGFTESLQYKYHDMRLVFCPEFLTEKNSIADFENMNRVILGGSQEDARVVYKYFEGRNPQRCLDGRLLVAQCSSTTAEMAKLFTNGILATKVIFSNEIYQMCQKLGIDYEEVRVLACLDSRIGASHTLVPGHDGFLGFGGHCFSKDVNNLRNVCKDLGVSEKIFTAVIERNDEIRESEGRDWEKMKGRAVIDE